MYAYAAAALFAHARLSKLAPPRSLAAAIGIGALMPACGCTALAYARRAPPKLRAPFLVAAYAVNPLLLVAAALLRGWQGALAVLALGLAAALVARLVPEGERPRARLDDLLLRRGASPLRDAAPYTMAFAAPALGIGAAVGMGGAWIRAADKAWPAGHAGVAQVAPALVGALAVGALALLFAAPYRDVAQDHGGRVARGVWGLQAAFAVACVGALALL
ncbi:MAG TPA: hypothetical protein VM370_04370 [Candidatus Thermoplasmatota archaeon]|nr:hypothetical protein [Candidatus Thermoplasmatota archaeon]